VKSTLLLVSAAALAVLATAPAASAKVIVGTPGDDTLAGTDERDLIYGRAGNDTMAGNGAADFLFGQKGMDALNGDDGPDRLWGGSEDDLLHGGDGPDWLWAGAGADQLFGEVGNDRLFAAADDGAVDTLDCGEHADDRDRTSFGPVTRPRAASASSPSPSEGRAHENGARVRSGPVVCRRYCSLA